MKPQKILILQCTNLNKSYQENLNFYVIKPILKYVRCSTKFPNHKFNVLILKASQLRTPSQKKPKLSDGTSPNTSLCFEQLKNMMPQKNTNFANYEFQEILPKNA